MTFRSRSPTNSRTVSHFAACHYGCPPTGSVCLCDFWAVRAAVSLRVFNPHIHARARLRPNTSSGQHDRTPLSPAPASTLPEPGHPAFVHHSCRIQQPVVRVVATIRKSIATQTHLHLRSLARCIHQRLWWWPPPAAPRVHRFGVFATQRRVFWCCFVDISGALIVYVCSFRVVVVVECVSAVLIAWRSIVIGGGVGVVTQNTHTLTYARARTETQAHHRHRRHRA